MAASRAIHRRFLDAEMGGRTGLQGVVEALACWKVRAALP